MEPIYRQNKRRKKNESPADKQGGRPPVPWTHSRQRRLLRFYICTDLPLPTILKAIAEPGCFEPKVRKAQYMLRNLLSESYERYRPVDREEMRNRIAYLRTLRTALPSLSSALSPIHNFNGAQTSLDTVVSLQYSHSTDIFGRRIDSTPNVAPTFLGQPERLFQSASSNGNTHYPHQICTVAAPTNSAPPLPYTMDTQPAREVNSAKHTQTSDDISSSISSQVISEDNIVEEKQLSRMSLLTEILSRGRSPSFVADCASLFSRLSISYSRRASFLSSKISLRDYKRRSSDGAHELRPESSTASLRRLPSYPPTESDLNHAVVQSCCRHSFPAACVHYWLGDAILSDDPTFELHRINVAGVGGKDAFGNNILHTAARWGPSYAVLEFLIDAVPDINTSNDEGETFLHLLNPWTARIKAHEYPPLMELLYKKGFHWGRRDNEGRTFLHKLAAQPHFPDSLSDAFLRRFASAGYSQDREMISRMMLYRDISGQSLEEQLRKRTETAGLLGMEYMAEFPLWLSGLTTFFCSSPVTRSQLGQCLMNGYNTSGCPSLMVYLRGAGFGANLVGFVDCNEDEFTRSLNENLESMIREGAGVNHRDRGGNTALHYASAYGLSETVRLLLSHNANIDARNRADHTPLDLAGRSYIRRPECAHLCFSKERYTAELMKTIIILLKHGASCNALKQYRQVLENIQQYQRYG